MEDHWKLRLSFLEGLGWGGRDQKPFHGRFHRGLWIFSGTTQLEADEKVMILLSWMKKILFFCQKNKQTNTKINNAITSGQHLIITLKGLYLFQMMLLYRIILQKKANYCIPMI